MMDDSFILNKTKNKYTFPSAICISCWVIYAKQAGVTLYPPNGAGCPEAASNPADTNTISGAYSYKIYK